MGTRRRPRAIGTRDARAIPFGDIIGGWWRFGSYEVVDGYVRPTTGATLKAYDPWADYREAQNATLRPRGWVPPYRKLMDLLAEVERDVANAGPALVDWCEEFGALGILLHRTHSVTLAPRWEHPGAGVPRDTVWPVARRYVLSADRWVELTAYPRGYRDALSSPSRRVHGFPSKPASAAGSLVSPRLRNPDWWPPGAIVRAPITEDPNEDLGLEEYRHEPLSKTWGRFFPSVPALARDTFAYPLPQSKPFWRLYAEPVDAIVAEATRLRRAIEALSAVWFPETADDVTVLESFATQTEGLNLFHSIAGPLRIALASPIRLALVPAGASTYEALRNSYRQVWASPSLLTTLAAMAILDHAQGTMDRRCLYERCGRRFTPRPGLSDYCTPRCRDTVKKRRHRKRKKGRTGGQRRKRVAKQSANLATTR